MTILNRIVKNGTASVLDKISKIFEQLLLVPFFIIYWGVAYYGDWITITILPTFFALANLGFGTAAGNTFVLKYTGGNKQEAANTVKTGLRVMHWGILVLLVLSLIILQFLNFFGFFSTLKIDPFDATWSVFFMFASAVITFYLAIFECYYRVIHQAHIGIFLRALTTFIKVGCGIFVLMIGANALEYSISIFIITLLANILYIYIAIKKINFKEYKKSVFNKEEAYYLFKKGLGYFLSPLWQAIYYQGTTFVIRLTLGSSAVVLFNTLRTLVNSSSQVFNIVVTAIYPEFQIAVGQKDTEKSKKLYAIIVGGNFVLAVLAVIFLLIFGQWLYGWWTHHQIEVPTLIWILMTIRIIFYALWYSYSFIFDANNNPYPLTISGVLVSILSVCATWLCSIYFGIVGGALGMLSFDLIMFIVLFVKQRKIISVRLQDYRYLLNDLVKFLNR